MDAARSAEVTKQRIRDCELNFEVGCEDLRKAGLVTGRSGTGDASRRAQQAYDEAKRARQKAEALLAVAEKNRAATDDAFASEYKAAVAAQSQARATLASAQKSRDALTKAVKANQATSSVANLHKQQDRLAKLSPQVAKLQQQREADLDHSNANSHNLNGIAARIEALDNVAKVQPTVANARLALSLLFISIEILPVLMKVLMNLAPPTPYDEELRRADKNDVRLARRRRRLADSDLHDQAELDRQIREDMLSHEAQTGKEVNRVVAQRHKQVVLNAVDMWSRTAQMRANAQLRSWQEQMNSDGLGVPPAFHDSARTDPRSADTRATEYMAAQGMPQP